MDFEHIVVIFAFIFYIVSLFKKKKSPSKKGAPSRGKDAKDKSGVLSNWGDRIKEAVKEIERQAAETQRKAKAKTGEALDKSSSDEWERFIARDEELQWEAADTNEELRWEPETASRYADRTSDLDSVPGRPISDAISASETEPETGPVVGAASMSASPGEAAFRPETLRNAIVWSEILDLPLALREERRNRFD